MKAAPVAPPPEAHRITSSRPRGHHPDWARRVARRTHRVGGDTAIGTPDVRGDAHRDGVSGRDLHDRGAHVGRECPPVRARGALYVDRAEEGKRVSETGQRFLYAMNLG